MGKFRVHLNDLFRQTITREQLAPLSISKGLHLSFRDAKGNPRPIRLKSARFGDIGWYFGHVCTAVRVARSKYHLRSISYAYKLSAWGTDQPFVRWEYVKTPSAENAEFCRHHVQGPLTMGIGERTIKLDKLHLPTGWVTIEDVIRFLISDLRVPALKRGWHAYLEQSYQKFREEFVVQPFGV